MTITLNLPESTEKALQELAARRGQDTAAFILSLVDEAILFEDFEPIPPDDPQERAEAIEGIRRGLEASAAGQVTPIEQVFADVKARHGIPD